MSSLRPGGAESASTSVTKPYLYSCLTRPSMVSVAVLIVRVELSFLLFGAIGADTVNRDFVVINPKSFWPRDNCGISRQRHIEHRAALVTVIMAMLLHVWAITCRTALELHLAHEAAFHQRIEAIINRGHGNIRHGLFGPDENLLRCRVIALLDQHVINMLSLGREAKTARAQPFSQVTFFFAMFNRVHSK